LDLGAASANANLGYALAALAVALCLASLIPRFRRWLRHLWAAPIVLAIAAIETLVSPGWIHPEFHGVQDVSVSLVAETIFWLASSWLLIQIIRLLVDPARRRGAAPPRIRVDVLGGAVVFFIMLHLLYNVFNVPLSAILATSTISFEPLRASSAFEPSFDRAQLSSTVLTSKSATQSSTSAIIRAPAP